TIVLFVLGLGGWLSLMARTPLTVLPGVEAVPEATLFVDKRSPVVVSLTVSPDRLLELRQVFAAPSQRRQAAQDIQRLQAGLLAQTQLDYERDIRPWLGNEVTFAVTSPDLDRDPQNGAQPGYLMALASRDGEQARQFMQLFWQKRAIAGENLTFEQYAGVKLIYAATAEQPRDSRASLPSSYPLASAVVGDRFVLLANSPTVLRQAVNAAQASNLNLQQAPHYRQALRNLPERRLGLIYCDFSQLSSWLVGLPEAAAVDRSEQKIDNLLVNLQLTGQGVLADTLLTAAAGEAFEPMRPQLSQPPVGLQSVPASAPFVAAGNRLSPLVEEINSGFRGYPVIQQLVEPLLDQLRNQWNIDLPSVLAHFGEGDYALAWLPRAEQPRSDWLFTIQNDAKTADYLATLDEQARQQGLSVGTLAVDEQPVTAWARLSAGTQTTDPDALALKADVIGLKAVANDQVILSTSAESLGQALAAGNRSILKSADFRQAIAALDADNNGYLYFDWPQVGDAIIQRSSQLRWLSTALDPFFKYLKSVTISSYDSDANFKRGGIFIRLVEAQ
ncbi:MAG: DUF3352 domain-containing protein, partial [Leptolyngbya sp. SIO4C5]|nr:DUF3352 domain-containing protein [Leptolyngbya sp. SIO4C5]